MDITSRKIPENNFILIHQKKLKNVKSYSKSQICIIEKKK